MTILAPNIHVYDGSVATWTVTIFICYLNVRYMLMRQCWHHLPDERPSFTELMSLLKEYWDEKHLYIVQTL